MPEWFPSAGLTRWEEEGGGRREEGGGGRLGVQPLRRPAVTTGPVLSAGTGLTPPLTRRKRNNREENRELMPDKMHVLPPPAAVGAFDVRR